MSQYDDSRNPFSSTSGQPESGSPWGESDASAASLGGLQLPGESNSTWGVDGSQRPSPIARRRNQWRQHQHLTPDFGTAASEPEPAKLPTARNASLPMFKRSAVPPTPQRPTTADPAIAPAPAPGGGMPLQMHPHSFQPGPQPRGGQSGETQSGGLAPHSLQFQNTQAAMPGLGGALGASGLAQGRPPAPGNRPTRGMPNGFAPSISAPGGVGPNRSAMPNRLPNNVTALRPGRRRSEAGPLPLLDPAGQAARSLGAAPDNRGAAGSGVRPRSPMRRRLANPPLPLLYLIRLIILGVGVAAIAGTLLSVLSPANVASSPEGSTSATQGGATVSGPLVQGSSGSTTADLRLTSEITHLKEALGQLATLTPGLTPAAFAIDLDSGQYVDLGGAEAVAAASTIKVPILVAFLQQVDAGTMALNQSLVLQEEYIAGGSGTLRSEPVGNEYTALEVATRMIVVSDNTATNMMIAALGGIEALNQTFADWGLSSTLLRNPLPDLEGTNTTSAKDLALIMALVDQGGLLTPRSRDRMFSIMQRTQNDSLIPSGIGDPSIKANKTGDIGSMLGDVALVDVPNGKRYALALMVQRPTNDGRASELIRRMTETIHAEMAQPVAPVGNPTAAPLSPPGEFEPSGTPENDAPQNSAPDNQGVDNFEAPAPASEPPLDRPPARDEVPPG